MATAAIMRFAMAIAAGADGAGGEEAEGGGGGGGAVRASSSPMECMSGSCQLVVSGSGAVWPHAGGAWDWGAAATSA